MCRGGDQPKPPAERARALRPRLPGSGATYPVRFPSDFAEASEPEKDYGVSAEATDFKEGAGKPAAWGATSLEASALAGTVTHRSLGGSGL